uniref:Uncharacterized protein n=1 Tax=Leersia perrieri TaxID=77586 RepID=A0A0D9XJ86_9ORYZ
MKKKSFHGNATYDPQHGVSKITGEATEHQQGNTAGIQTAKSKPWKKRYLTFLSKFQNKMKHKKPDNIKAAAGGSKNHRSPKKRSILLSIQILEECSNLVQVIRQTTADCFAAAATAVAASVEYEDDQPYMQLDQVNYGVKRDAFGPVYLVT